MLTLTRKEFEIEEPIVLADENGDYIYEFVMKITAEEKNKIRDLIFDEKDVENGRKLSKLEREGKEEELAELEAKVIENARKRQEEFENICFKEHKEPFKEKAGQYKYDELVEAMMGFFINFFVERQLKPINTSIMNLKSLMNK